MTSNRHWPNMFKLKPSTPHHQWHEMPSSTMSNQRLSSSEGASAQYEERSPEPKPRWNPKPEQIRILEAIFNSGMVNPPRDEIRRIRTQLQEFGQVGDANVFYWFQNRKSRTKQKQRHLQTTERKSSSTERSSSSCDQSKAAMEAYSIQNTIGESSSSSTSFSKPQLEETHESNNNNMEAGMMSTSCVDTTGSQSFSLPPQPYSSFLLNEGDILDSNTRVTVFINDVPFEVPMGPVNIRAAFGEDAVLVHSSGQPVLVNEWGITLQGLQHGAMYYLI
uniref:HD transcription factor n=1 Tax=Ginkgo biloba TaxID=3311 RepID=S6D0S8_GINBI|nr:HD transcription factor [Ginkgo biloba]